MTARAARPTKIRKRKAARKIPRAKLTRVQGNTAGVRTRLKKQAGIKRGKAAKA